MGEAETGRCRPSTLSVIDDKEIWACASLLLKQHGGDAWFVASQRADALAEIGDMTGSRTFQRIVNRIRELEQMAPRGSTH